MFEVNKSQDIIAAIDKYLEFHSLESIGAVKAAYILDNLKIISDSKDRPGKHLRKYLRNGSIPHAYKSGSNWVIPHSSLKVKKSVSTVANVPSSIVIHSSNSNEKRQEMQISYKPSLVKYLLIAEAPPNNLDRYFYFNDVKTQDALFLNITQALFPKLKDEYLLKGRNPNMKHHILEEFRLQGFYLIDLSKTPKVSEIQMKIAIDTLTVRVKSLINEDTKIIIIKASVYDLIYDILKSNFQNTIDVRIPFPGQGHQKEFHRQFKEALNKAGYCL